MYAVGTLVHAQYVENANMNLFCMVCAEYGGCVHMEFIRTIYRTWWMKCTISICFFYFSFVHSVALVGDGKICMIQCECKASGKVGFRFDFIVAFFFVYGTELATNINDTFHWWWAEQKKIFEVERKRAWCIMHRAWRQLKWT